jgi:hypothetical protein
MNSCIYCNSSAYGAVENIATQRFNDGTISNVKLNPYNTSLLSVDTWNVPIVGREANMYSITKRINFCPMCGRNFKEVSEQ